MSATVFPPNMSVAIRMVQARDGRALVQVGLMHEEKLIFAFPEMDMAEESVFTLGGFNVSVKQG